MANPEHLASSSEVSKNGMRRDCQPESVIANHEPILALDDAIEQEQLFCNMLKANFGA